MTASGTRARYGVCAADCAVPYGTRLHIPGYGVAVVEDRGGGIKGDRLDVYFDDVADAREWGVRRVRVVILE